MGQTDQGVGFQDHVAPAGGHLVSPPGGGLAHAFARVRERPRGSGFWLWPLRPLARALLKRQLARCGSRTRFDPLTSTFGGIRNISLGDDVFIGPRCFISVPNVRLSIGDDTVIGPELCVMGGDHKFDVPGTLYRETRALGVNEPIAIGCNVWIGARVTILKGVRIGDGALIGAGSIVTRDVPSQGIAVGTPARVVGWRFEGTDRDRHDGCLAGLWGRVQVDPPVGQSS
jgi:acetyltransferase-like isoleucine patch superfamily enzyme